MKKINSYLFVALIFSCLLFSGCGDNDVPPAENEEEIIDKVTLSFTPDSGGSAIVITAFDPDGEGVDDFEIDTINLSTSTNYTLSVRIENASVGENITDEISKEAEEHMFFFAFTDGIFSSPAGNGNIDNRADAINYNDKDANNLPLGLLTTWVTGDTPSTNGTFRMILKHQPDGIKSATSTATDGETDIDITWPININQ